MYISMIIKYVNFIAKVEIDIIFIVGIFY